MAATSATASTPRDPFRGSQRLRAAQVLVLRLFLTCLSVFFGAAILALAIVRLSADSLAPWQGASLPAPIWVSTTLLLFSALTLERGYQALRAGNRIAFERSFRWSSRLATLFLLCQAWAWSSMLGRLASASSAEGAAALAWWSFIVLTSLHALHVIGGLVPFAAVRRRAHAGRYTASSHAGVSLLRTYWHFLGIVWLVLLGVLAWLMR